MMFHRSAVSIRRAFAYIAIAACAIFAALVIPAQALAEETIATLTATMTAGGQSTDISADFTDSAELLESVNELSDNDLVSAITIDLKADWNINGRILVKGNTSCTINLHGHMINRGLFDSDYPGDGSGRVFAVGSSAELTINGGTGEESKIEHNWALSYSVDELGNYFWKPDLNGDTVISGGVITGGAAESASAISASSNSKIQLNNVSFVGNKTKYYGAVTLWGSNISLNLDNAHFVYNRTNFRRSNYDINGGGGLSVCGENCNVVLTNGSEISHNYSVFEGGGVYVTGEGCQILLDNASHIDNNYAYYFGGGIYTDSVNGKVTVRGGSSISGNYAVRSGGAVANYYSFTKGANFNFAVEVEGEGSEISNNESELAGGAIYTDSLSNVKLSDGASISNNRAPIGGAIYINHPSAFDAVAKITMTGGSSISDNIATESGGAIYSDGGCSVESDSTSSIYGNSANIGGAIWFKGEISLKGVNITGNTASSQGGGVYCTNTSFYTFLVGGTVNITGNTVKGAASNVVMKEDQDLNGMAGADALTADSRIGVTCVGYDGTDRRKVSGNSKFLDLVGDKYKKVVVSDNLAYSVVEDAGLLYLCGEPTTFDVLVYTSSDDDAEPVNTFSATYGSTVILKAEDYKNAEGLEPDYWTIKFPSRTVTTSSGTAQIAIPRGDVKAIAHYQATLTGLHVNLSDSSTWDTLGEAANVSVTALTIKASDGAEIELSEDAISLVRVTNVIGGGDASSVRLIYTVQVPVSVAKKYGIAVPSIATDASEASVHTAFGDVSIKADDPISSELSGENIFITIGCTLNKPADESHTVTVNCLDINNASGAALHTFAVTTDSSGNASVTAPQIAGWKFSRWVNPASVKKTISVEGLTDDTTLTCEYEPVLSDVWVQLAYLEVGEAFPEIEGSGYSRPAALSSGMDVRSNVVWTCTDGSEVGDAVDGSTTYRATVTVTPIDSKGRTFSLDAVCDQEAGGNPESVSLSEDGKSFVVTYLLTSPADTSFDCVVTDLSTIDVEEPSEAQSYLPENIDYLLKDGELKSADVTWEAIPTDVPAGCLFTVKGTFTDSNDMEHDIERSFNVIETVYIVDLIGGTAYNEEGDELEDGCAAEGEVVTIVADEPDEGMEFDCWVVTDDNIELTDATSATTTFTMPAEDVKLQATYKEKSGGGEPDPVDPIDPDNPDDPDPDDDDDTDGDDSDNDYYDDKETNDENSSAKKGTDDIPMTSDASTMASIVALSCVAASACVLAVACVAVCRRKR